MFEVQLAVDKLVVDVGVVVVDVVADTVNFERLMTIQLN